MSDVSPDSSHSPNKSPASTDHPPGHLPTQGRMSSEPEHQGSIWKHPYLIYILLTVILFAGLLVAAWLAQMNDWIPKR